MAELEEEETHLPPSPPRIDIVTCECCGRGQGGCRVEGRRCFLGCVAVCKMMTHPSDGASGGAALEACVERAASSTDGK